MELIRLRRFKHYGQLGVSCTTQPSTLRPKGRRNAEHTEGHGEKLFEAVRDLGLEGIVSKRLTAVYRSGPSRTWIKVKNPKAPAATRARDGTF
jgi:hypothetical protein